MGEREERPPEAVGPVEGIESDAAIAGEDELPVERARGYRERDEQAGSDAFAERAHPGRS